MKDNLILPYIQQVLANSPAGWLATTTHRLDIYEENRAKTQFLEQFEALYIQNNASTEALGNLSTAYDYIRLGHPLSCVLEWAIAKLNHLKADNVISFASKTAPILAVLRKNSIDVKSTHIYHIGELPTHFDVEVVKNIYGYQFDLQQITDGSMIPSMNGSTILITNEENVGTITIASTVDFHISLHGELGSVLVANGAENENYVAAIQHVRRRETVAMTPADSLIALQSLVLQKVIITAENNVQADKKAVLEVIQNITNSNSTPLVASSGLSIQYAIMMGLVHNAAVNHPNKAIKIIVPPNCYGGTNDQARRIAECLPNVDIVDLLVDGENDMVQSIDSVLAQIAFEDAVPYIIAEIPTNPRVEVPNLIHLKNALSQERKTASGSIAIDPVFILDQTFCPNVHFLGQDDILADVRTISFASGSKFPSGGKCTAGYCVGNKKTKALMDKIALHLALCDNEATDLQYAILAQQLPSMNQRIADAYVNTRDFVNFITKELPTAKINFVSEELARQGFTPSVFSLDLPTQGNTPEEKEAHKRELNLKLINLMITKIPNESKFCVSYGQLKGCYWTIPATSTQGTTKEGDKDYIVRASLSPDLDLDLHKQVFLEFVKSM